MMVFSQLSLFILCWSEGALLRVPPKVAFFAWEASWGKVLTQEQLQRRGFSLANRCFLCLFEEETVDHLLLHCVKTRVLWNLLSPFLVYLGLFRL